MRRAGVGLAFVVLLSMALFSPGHRALASNTSVDTSCPDGTVYVEYHDASGQPIEADGHCFKLPVDGVCAEGLLIQASQPGWEVDVCHLPQPWSVDPAWYADDQDNPLPQNGDQCPDGYFALTAEQVGLDHAICSPIPEDPGNDNGHGSGGGEQLPTEIGAAWVSSIDGANCRDQPNGKPIMPPLAFGTAVTWIADGNHQDGWQWVNVETDQPNCYIRADLLSDTPPTGSTSSNQGELTSATDPPVTSDVNTEILTGPNIVTTLPNTGGGPMIGPKLYSKQLLWRIALVIVLIMVVSIILIEFRSRSHRLSDRIASGKPEPRP